MTDPAITWQYADFAETLRLENVPVALIEKAKLHILDTIGCALAAAQTDYASSTFAAFARLEGGNGSVAFGRPQMLGLRDSILFNAGLANAQDFDDTYTPTLNHISGGAVPMVLALGARQGHTGRAVLAAYLVAMEIGARVGLGVPGNAVMRRGFSTSGTFNSFSNALAAGKLLKLTNAALVSAQGIALSLMGGAIEGLRDGAWSKRLTAGLGANTGLMAATMAAEGVSGPARPYDGATGLYRLLLGADVAVDWRAMTDGLGSRWEFEKVSIKAFPFVHHAHNIVEGAIAMHRDDGVRPDDIDEIVVYVTAHQIPLICEPQSERRHPPNKEAGLFSIYHLVAAAIARGRLTLDECEADVVDDPTIRKLRDRVRYDLDTDSLFPEYFSGGLCAKLSDGRLLTKYEQYHLCSDKRPMETAAVVEKFRHNASRTYTDRRIGAIVNAVMALDDGATPQSVVALLGGP